MTRRILSTLIVLGAALQAYAQNNVQKYVDDLSCGEVLGNAVWGMLAVRADGDTLASFNSTTRMVPASNTKLITTGVALHALGEDFRFKTSIAYDGTLEDGVLKGNLYIVGGMDPTTGAKQEFVEGIESLFGKWETIIREAGINSIEGCIIGDGRCLDGGRNPYEWTYADMGFYYGTPFSGLCFYENTQDIYVAPGAEVGEAIEAFPVYPETPWMLYSMKASTGPQGSGDDICYIASEFTPYAEIRGTYALGARGRDEACSNRFPEYTCAALFHDFLTEKGLAISGGYADIAASGAIRDDLVLYDEERLATPHSELSYIGETYSPALKDIVTETLYESDNFFAEAMLRTLGKLRQGSSSYGASILEEKAVLRSMGLNVNVQIADGSGLSRKNYISPDFFVRFLFAMMDTPEFETYLNAIPQPGKGTLAPMLAGSAQDVRSRVHMKSGSMNGVRCYSGYILPKSGNPEETVAFSILTDNVISSSASVMRIMDNLITLMAE